MLSKCLKHEFRATWRTIVPILIAVVLLSGLSYLASSILYAEEALENFGLMEIIALILQMFYTLAIGAASIGVVIVCVLRYWRSFHSDEGYLTMTMPVSTHVHILSKLIVAVCWTLALLVVVWIGSLLSNVGIFQQYANAAEEAQLTFEMMGIDENVIRQSAVFMGLVILSSVIGSATSMVTIYAAISLGHSFQKYKKLLSVVFVFVFNQLAGILMVVPAVAFFISAVNNIVVNDDISGLMSGMNVMIGIMLVISVVCGVIFYFVAHHYLTKKLNLQ